MAFRVPTTLRDSFFSDPFFRSTWDDFDRLRDEMLKESYEFWEKAEREMRQMTHQSLEYNSSSSSSKKTSQLAKTDEFRPSFFPRRWMMPRLFDDNMENMMKSLDIFQDKDDQVVRFKDDKDKFEVSLDTQGFRPDEMKVNVNGNLLTIEAKHEEKSPNKCVSRQFSRQYTLPDECIPDKVNSNLSSDGILMITAPKKPALEGNRKIPITHNRH